MEIEDIVSDFDYAHKILLKLLSANGQEYDMNEGDITSIFNVIDLDGNGTISWFEWKSTISTLLSADSVDFSLDPLGIQIRTFLDIRDFFLWYSSRAVEARAKSPDTVSASVNLSTVRLSNNWLDSDLKPAFVPLGKLHEKMKDIRESHSTLARKLETAIIDAQKLCLLETLDRTGDLSALDAVSSVLSPELRFDRSKSIMEGTGKFSQTQSPLLRSCELILIEDNAEIVTGPKALRHMHGLEVESDVIELAIIKEREDERDADLLKNSRLQDGIFVDIDEYEKRWKLANLSARI
jgi:hypothetical protein